jgi:diguanylate cyclase (GGDEF)-like protein
MPDATRALIIDDDAVTRLLVGSAMRGAGHEVREHDSGETAMAGLAACRPELILLDIEMPGMGGLAFCRWLRAQPACHNLPVLVMTAHDDSETIQSAFDAGASDFIAKPLNFNILLHRVRFLLRARDNLHALERSRRNLAEAQSIARLGSWELDRVSGIAECSSELFTVLGHDPQDTERSIEGFIKGVHPDDLARVRAAIATAGSERQPADVIHRYLGSDRQLRWLHLRVKFEYDEDGRSRRSYGTVQDITAQRRIEERIDYLTHHDALTGLPNRDNFLQSLGAEIGRYGELERVAVMHIALERYQRISDSLGHEAGDTVLRMAAERVRRCLPCAEPAEVDGRTLLARWSGGELMLMRSSAAVTHEASRLAHAILDKLRTPFRIGEDRLVLGAHIGIALHPLDGTGATALTHAASIASHHARSNGQAEPQFHSAEIQDEARLRIELERDLRRALADEEDGGLTLYYQPKYDQDGHIGGAEALVRWTHPRLGLLPPARFVPLAEESRLIIPLGEWVIRRACRQLRTWMDAGVPEVRLALNLATPHFVDPGLLPLLVAETAAHGIRSELIELELTESMLMNDTEYVRDTLRHMHERGFRLAIDDFGMGYSSLSQLSFLPLDTLKIDRAFIQDMLEVPRQAAVVRGIIALAKGLGLSVVAEGVETPDQATALRDEGCDLMQGFHFARPLTAADFADRLAGTP